MYFHISIKGLLPEYIVEDLGKISSVRIENDEAKVSSHHLYSMMYIKYPEEDTWTPVYDGSRISIGNKAFNFKNKLDG